MRAPSGSAAAAVSAAKASSASRPRQRRTVSGRDPSRLRLALTTTLPPLLRALLFRLLVALLLLLPVLAVLLPVLVRLVLLRRAEVGAGAVGRQRGRVADRAVALVGCGAVRRHPFGR